jgi:hypothetical protein
MLGQATILDQMMVQCMLLDLRSIRIIRKGRSYTAATGHSATWATMRTPGGLIANIFNAYGVSRMTGKI